MTRNSLSCSSYLYTATPPTAIVVATPAILTSQLLVISCRSTPVDFCSALSICQLFISPLERRDRRDSAYMIVERYQRLLLSRYVRLGSRFFAFVSFSLPVSFSVTLTLSLSSCFCIFISIFVYVRISRATKLLFCLSPSLSLSLWQGLLKVPS